MQRLHIIAVGKLSEQWLREGCAHYQKRIARYYKLETTELDECRLPEQPSPAQIEQALKREAAAFGRALPARCVSVALCVEGSPTDTEQLAQLLVRAGEQGRAAAFLIGSSHGLSAQLKQGADVCLSLSPMTFPHQLARLLLLEQLYRCGNMQTGGKYHK